jgi:hypothetical protein
MQNRHYSVCGPIWPLAFPGSSSAGISTLFSDIWTEVYARNMPPLPVQHNKTQKDVD